MVTAPPRHSVSVAAAIVRDDGRVLCIRRDDNGHWEPPGGVLELGERIHDGLIREVEEETGVLVEPDTLTGIYQNEPRDILALVFRCDIVEGTPKVTQETKNVEWLNRSEIEDRMSQSYAVRLTDALDFAGQAAIRTHDGKRLTT